MMVRDKDPNKEGTNGRTIFGTATTYEIIRILRRNLRSAKNEYPVLQGGEDGAVYKTIGYIIEANDCT